MKERYLVIGFQPATQRISLDSEWAESATGAMTAVAGIRKAADVLLAWTPGQMRQMADLLTAMTPAANCIQPPIGRTRRESIPAPVKRLPHRFAPLGLQSQPFLVISYNPVTEAVHLDTELSDSPDAALSSVAGIRGLAHVLLAFTPEQLREMAANLEGCTAEQIARNRRAAEQEEQTFYAELTTRQ